MYDAIDIGKLIWKLAKDSEWAGAGKIHYIIYNVNSRLLFHIGIETHAVLD